MVSVRYEASLKIVKIFNDFEFVVRLLQVIQTLDLIYEMHLQTLDSKQESIQTMSHTQTYGSARLDALKRRTFEEFHAICAPAHSRTKLRHARESHFPAWPIIKYIILYSSKFFVNQHQLFIHTTNAASLPVIAFKRKFPFRQSKLLAMSLICARRQEV